MYIYNCLAHGCSTINTNPETNIGVQPKSQKSKTANRDSYHNLSSEMVILPPGILRMRLSESCVLQSSIPL